VDVHALLGDEADSLLTHASKGIPRDDLVWPRPDFIDRVFLPTDRSPRVLRSGRKSFQRPMAQGVELLHALQDVYRDETITIA
jgi:class I fructose-bisphosphate aldolase